MVKFVLKLFSNLTTQYHCWPNALILKCQSLEFNEVTWHLGIRNVCLMGSFHMINHKGFADQKKKP